MIYICSYCGDEIRPRDDRRANGNPDAVSHGMCNRCSKIALSDLDLTTDEIARRSVALVPACQRAGGL